MCSQGPTQEAVSLAIDLEVLAVGHYLGPPGEKRVVKLCSHFVDK